MSDPTAREQLILELVNRARMDPLGEAARYKIDLNKDLAPGTLTGTPKQVLAMNVRLNDAADAHSAWMLGSGTFSHTGAGGSSPGSRMTGAGYLFSGSWSWGENIAWTGTTGTMNGDTEAAKHHQNLFLSAGHRENILNGGFREIGIGSLTGKFQGYNALMTTEDFARSGTQHFITGVCYKDTDNNDFYSVGEGQGGIQAQLLQGSTVLGAMTSQGAGGYAIGTDATGACEIRYSGGALAGPMGAKFTAGSTNIKADLVDNGTIVCNVSATLTGKAAGLQLLGIEKINATGNGLANTIIGNSGDNVIAGLGGADTLTGGLGADRFEFRSVAHCQGDVITDFDPLHDVLSFQKIDAIPGVAGSAFTFDGAAFDGKPGSLIAVLQNGKTLVQGDLNGDKVADFTVTLNGLHTLDQSDFIL